MCTGRSLSDGLVPFTRWVTPTAVPKRFTTQMYVYLMPLGSTATPMPKHDGGLEHTAAEFASPGAWMERSQRGEIIVISPQTFLLSMLADFFKGGDPATERAALLSFLNTVPTGPSGHATTQIAWKDKVISPTPSGLSTADGRMIIALDGPGPELQGQRAGDWDRVVVSRRERTGPSEARVCWRSEVWPEAEAAARDARVGAKQEAMAKL